MTEFENLKNNYVMTIQIGLNADVGYHEATQGNNVLHKFCENLIENSCYAATEKTAMKSELDLLKETLAKEIDSHYRKG